MPRRTDMPSWAYDLRSESYVVFPMVSDDELPDVLLFAHNLYGADNVMVGDVFGEQHSLDEHPPSVGIYVTREGLAHAEQHWLLGGLALSMQELGNRLDVLEKLMRRQRRDQ